MFKLLDGAKIAIKNETAKKQPHLLMFFKNTINYILHQQHDDDG